MQSLIGKVNDQRVSIMNRVGESLRGIWGNEKFAGARQGAENVAGRGLGIAERLGFTEILGKGMRWANKLFAFFTGTNVRAENYKANNWQEDRPFTSGNPEQLGVTQGDGSGGASATGNEGSASREEFEDIVGVGAALAQAAGERKQKENEREQVLV